MVISQLKRFIPQLLFDAKYIDLLIRFKPIEIEIKKALCNEAEAIGYEIKQLITVPALEEIKLKDNFTIDTTGTFQTKLRGVPVKLNIIVITRIKNLEDIEHFLNRLQDVPKLMEESILDVTGQYLHNIDPERFYMRFNFTDVPNERPVETDLIETITNKLTEKFTADVIGVIIKVVETEITDKLRNLQENICPFEVKIKSLFGGEDCCL